MSSLMASFVDGKLQTQTASSTSISNKDKNESGVTSEAFLQLLVAEMQNQDPLEPTSNTEWISQYATFTEVSEIQAIGDAMNAVKAQDLVGEYVIMKVTNEQGSTDFVSGQVDYVVYENKDTFLSINGELYSIKDLDTVADPRYMEAYDLANGVAEKLKKLPKVDDLTLGYKDQVEEIYQTTKNMNDYEKSFLDKSVFELIDNYYQKLQTLLPSQESSSDSSKGSSEETDKAGAAEESNASAAEESATETGNISAAEEASAEQGNTGAAEEAAAETVNTNAAEGGSENA